MTIKFVLVDKEQKKTKEINITPLTINYPFRPERMKITLNTYS